MTTISFPFRVDEHGHIAKTRLPAKVNQDRVRAVLNTQSGDRPMRPSFGSDVESLIMDLDRVGEAGVRGLVGLAFKEHLPDLHLKSTSLVFDREDSLTGTIMVEFNGPDGTTDVASVQFSDGIVAFDPHTNSEVIQ